MNDLEKCKQELLSAENVGFEKDILIVVHDQLDYTKQTIESIQESTENYNLYLWDNASKTDTKTYLEELSQDKNVHLIRSEENIGFIKPMNRLIEKTTAPFIILINSDCQVYDGWDRAMIGFLIENPDYGQVGYHGGHINEHGKGHKFNFGDDIQYVCGYCFCISRKIYEQFGLFDEKNLEFAYCEDSDFSFRLQEKGLKVYSLFSRLVKHFQNKTVMTVLEERDISNELKNNSEYIRKRWVNLLNKS